MARHRLFEKIIILSSNIHRIKGENDPYREAQRYSEEISEYVRFPKINIRHTWLPRKKCANGWLKNSKANVRVGEVPTDRPERRKCIPRSMDQGAEQAETDFRVFLKQ